MSKARRNRKDKSHLSKKRAERWYKRLIAAEIKREKKRHQEELGLNSEGPEPSFSPSSSPIPKHWSATHYETRSPRSRMPSPTSYESDCYNPYYINHPDEIDSVNNKIELNGPCHTENTYKINPNRGLSASYIYIYIFIYYNIYN